jgi:glutathionylspermidine synthase
MKRTALAPRPDWQKKAEDLGFTFHTMHGQAYWDETSAYEFTLAQIENDIEDPSTELHAMCLDAVDAIVGSEELMTKLCIPSAMQDYVAQSWRNCEPALYGRFDLSYDGTGPAKMLEYNADTPTSLYEAASFQWTWFEDMLAAGQLPKGSDQFNSIHDALVNRLRMIMPKGSNLHFTSFRGDEEDFATVEYLAWVAKEAGLHPHYVPLDGIGLTDAGQFADDQSRVIGSLFKLYPWEDLMRDDFAANIPGSKCSFIEPAWKALLSNKGILPILWERNEGHPNLLPAFFAADVAKGSDIVRRSADALGAGFVEKPIFSREGASVRIYEGDKLIDASESREYDEHPMIVQGYAPLPSILGNRPVIGAWMVWDECVGMGVREDNSRITQDLSRFKPHFILD